MAAREDPDERHDAADEPGDGGPDTRRRAHD